MRKSMLSRVSWIAVVGLVAGLATVANAAEFTETLSFSSKSLKVINLIGEVTVSGGSGSDFKVVVHVRGADASRGEVGFEKKNNTLAVVFPDSKRFVYPHLGADNVRFSAPGDDGGWINALFGNSQIKVSERGSGTEIWADIEIQVPDGARFTMKQGAGEIHVKGVEADLVLDSHFGRVTVEAVDGDLLVDTGSGEVHVDNYRGSLSVDTGSGDVKLSGIQGPDLNVDTGSGDVSLIDVIVAGEIAVDTGSGDVSLTDVTGDKFEIDTGSGDVEGEGIRAASASIDTGSGQVSLMFVEMGNGRFDVDTGSGKITLGLPADASCDVEAEAGSGRVVVDMTGVKNVGGGDEDEVQFTVGAGSASVRLDTGSGGIRIVDSN